MTRRCKLWPLGSWLLPGRWASCLAVGQHQLPCCRVAGHATWLLLAAGHAAWLVQIPSGKGGGSREAGEEGCAGHLDHTQWPLLPENQAASSSCCCHLFPRALGGRVHRGDWPLGLLAANTPAGCWSSIPIKGEGQHAANGWGISGRSTLDFGWVKIKGFKAQKFKGKSTLSLSIGH